MERDFDTLAVIGTRALHLAAFAVLLGGQLVAGWIAPPDRPRQLRLLYLMRAASLAALITAALWLLTQAADMADAAPTPAVLATVLLSTTFGAAMSARLGLAVLLALLLRADRDDPSRQARLTAVLSVAAIATFAATGHGNAARDAVLTWALVAHVLAASAWLGGLLPLWIILPDAGTGATRRFSCFGLGCVAVLAAAAIAQAPLIGAWPGMIGTAYGQVILVKLCLLLLLLSLATANLAASLRNADARRLRALRRRVLAETVLGAAAISAASWLVQLPPAAHQQVEWPFAWRPSLLALGTPELRPELLCAALMLLAAVPAVVGATRIRSARLPGLAIAAALVLWALPSLGLLLVPAYPTSFYRSPTGFSADSVLLGARLYPRYCAGCHGSNGAGDGVIAAGLRIPPADLTAPHLWDHSDGELFWWISDGMRDAEGALVMPGFAPALGDDERWALIDFIRARNAGLVIPAAGAAPIWVEGRIAELGLRARTHAGGMHAHHAS